MLTPSLAAGGVGINTLQKLQDSRAVEWVAIILTDGAASDPTIVNEIVQQVPVYGGVAHKSQNAETVDRSMSYLDRLRTFKGQVDAIYTWGHGPKDLPQILQEEFPETAIVVGLHGEGAWTEGVVKAFEPVADAFYCVSRAVLKCVPDRGLSRCQVIPNGVDLRHLVPSETREQTRQRWGLAPQEIAVGFVGRISPEKNPAVVAEAVAELGAGFRAVYISPQAHGRPKIWGAAEMERIQATQTAAPIVWSEGIISGTRTPQQTLMADAYQALDVLVMSSHEEGGPLVILEAMAASCAVVATPVGLVPDLQRQHGDLMTLLPMNPSPSDVATGIQQALRPERQPLMKQAREVMLYEHNSRRMTRDFERLIQTAAAQVKEPPLARAA